MRHQYQVFSVDWMDDSPFIVTCHDRDEACEDWAEYMERCGEFADGFPKNHELRVVGPDGETRHIVNTDFTPTYHVSDKDPSP